LPAQAHAYGHTILSPGSLAVAHAFFVTFQLFERLTQKGRGGLSETRKKDRVASPYRLWRVGDCPVASSRPWVRLNRENPLVFIFFEENKVTLRKVNGLYFPLDKYFFTE